MRRFLERKSRGQCQGVPIASLLAEAFWRCRGQIFVRRIPVRLRDVQTYKVLHYSIEGDDGLNATGFGSGSWATDNLWFRNPHTNACFHHLAYYNAALIVVRLRPTGACISRVDSLCGAAQDVNAMRRCVRHTYRVTPFFGATDSFITFNPLLGRFHS
jgi:hypothetical protein